MLTFPSGFYYSRDHIWLLNEGREAKLGLTAFAAAALGDIQNVMIVDLAIPLEAGACFGTVETVKTIADLWMPVSGLILEVNPKIVHAPEIINADPYGWGWLVRIALKNSADPVHLLDVKTYQRSYHL